MQDYEGDSNDVEAVRSYFKKRFKRLGRRTHKEREKEKAQGSKTGEPERPREIFIQ